MKGQFGTREKLKAFIDPLVAASAIMADNGVILNAVTADKSVQMFAHNTDAGTLIYLTYPKELFDGFTFAATDEKIGIMKLSEFIKYFSVIEDDGVAMDFENNKFSLSYNTEHLSFKTADADLIKEAGKNFKPASMKWFSEVEVDKKFTKLIKAMNVLSNEDCVVVSGSKADSKVTFTVKSSTVDINNFKFEVDAAVTEDFSYPYIKNIFQLILATGSEKIKMSISERLIMFDCANKYSSMKFFLAKKVSKG